MDVTFFLSSSVSSNIMVKVHRVSGLPPVNVLEQKASRYYSPSVCSEEYELFVEVSLFQNGMRLGLPQCCSYQLFPAGSPCIWDEWLRLPVRYCDVSRDAQLVFTVFAVSPVLSDDKLISTSLISSESSSSSSSSKKKKKQRHSSLLQKRKSKGDPDAPAIESFTKTADELLEYINTQADWSRLKPRVVGGVTLPLFEGYVLRGGRHKLRLAEGIRGDGSMDSPTLFYKMNKQETVKDRLEATLTRKRSRRISPDPWLDGITAKRISKAVGLSVAGSRKSGASPALISPGGVGLMTMDDCLKGIYLSVDLLNFGSEVVFHQPLHSVSNLYFRSHPHSRALARSDASAAAVGSSGHPSSGIGSGSGGISGGGGGSSSATSGPYRTEFSESLAVARAMTALSLLTVDDSEMSLSNPVADKDKRLLKYSTDGEMKPDKKERERLDKIIKSPTRELTEEDKRMLWTFRSSLVENKKALTKFLRCVSQTNEDDMKTAVELMDRWAPIDVADSLELLSAAFENEEIRRYAIGILSEQATDEDLESFLMQLVQAIRFERSHHADLPQFLLRRSLESDDFRLTNFLYWSVKVQAESKDPKVNRLYTEYLSEIERQMTTRRPKFAECIDNQKWLIQELLDLSAMIAATKAKADVQKAKLRDMLKNDDRFRILSNFPKPVRLPVRPDVVVNGIVPEKCSVFKSAMCPFLLCFRRCHLARARIESFLEAATPATPEPGMSSAFTHVLPHSGLPPTVEHDGSDMEDDEDDDLDMDEEYDSSKLHLGSKLKGTASDPEYYRIIWKNGDDLRQDQLIIQMIHLMDKLLKNLQVSMCLTPYPVLATGMDHGMLEFVENSQCVFDILKEYNQDLRQYLSKQGGKKTKIQAVVDNFVKSSAGYGVITFLLGVGDRHLHNLLMISDGRLFHIDFGFIYGEDPKPWPPPMKICKPMIDAMGGYESPQYKDFLNHMSTCYNLLRKNANLILNLLALMGQGDRATIEKNLNYVYNKFRLDLSDQAAANYLSGLVEESVNALFVKFVDKIHDWATYWR